MLDESPISPRDDVDTFENSSVGDDDGNREYPFVTSPKVLEVMRKLNEINSKQLVQDFISSIPEYDLCPKGSLMTKYCKPAIPGPFCSCPILHESGYDFLSLPMQQRRSPRVKINYGIISRRQKKRSNCRKCSHVTFMHVDSSVHHENYLVQCTYSKLKTSLSSSACHLGKSSRASSHYNILSKQKSYPCLEETEDGHCLDCPPSWADLKDLIDPHKPSKVTEPKIKEKKRLKSAVKPVVTSRYRNVTTRRTRSTVNKVQIGLHDESSTTGDGPKNPFPMPDIFEEIYFGKMPESLNSLSVPLQNFKKMQMKMAGDSNVCIQPTESCPNKGRSTVLRTTVINNNSTFLEGNPGLIQVRKNQSPLPLPAISNAKNVPPGPNKTISSNLDVIKRLYYTEILSKKIEKTAENAINNLNNANRQNLTSRKTKLLNKRNLQSAGKKRSLILHANKKPQRKSKSHAALLQSSLSRVDILKRQHMTEKLALKEYDSQMSKNFGTSDIIKNVDLHEEINGSFHDEEGMFSTLKYRQSLIRFIERKGRSDLQQGASRIDKIIHNNGSVKADTNILSHRPSTPFKKVSKRPNITEFKRKKLKSRQEKSSNIKPVTITIYKRGSAACVGSNNDVRCNPGNGQKLSHGNLLEPQMNSGNPMTMTSRHHLSNSSSNVVSPRTTSSWSLL